MPVLDLTQTTGTADVVLAKFMVEADSGSDAITFKVYVQSVLSSRSEAERAAATLPGLAEAYDLAGEEDNWKGALSVKPDDSLKVVLTAKEQISGRQGAVAGGGVIIQGTAELVEVKAALSKKARTVLTRLVFRGQASSVAAGLADNLGRTVGMSFERVQGVLDFSQKLPGLKVGMIAAVLLSDGSQVAGRVTEVAGDEVSVVECGREYGVSVKSVLGSFAFSDDADTQAALADYEDRCQRRRVPVSWKALVDVVGKNMGLEDGQSLGNGARICLEDVEAAVLKVAPPSDATETVETKEESTADHEPVRVVPPAKSQRGRRVPQAVGEA